MNKQINKRGNIKYIKTDKLIVLELKLLKFKKNKKKKKKNFFFFYCE